MQIIHLVVHPVSSDSELSFTDFKNLRFESSVILNGSQTGM